MTQMNPFQKTIVRLEETLDHFLPNWRSGEKVGEPVIVMAYRGYGNDDEIRVLGRVLFDPGTPPDVQNNSRWDNVVEMLKRYASREIPGAHLELRFGGAEVEAKTDSEGYFEARLPLDNPVDPGQMWHKVHVELLEPAWAKQLRRDFTVEVQVPRPATEFGIISDIDDTIMRTGAINFLQHAGTVLLNNARTRTPFEGVHSFYTALVDHADGQPKNPIFYVSSSPWNIYDLFEAFIQFRDLPRGPILLKDFGFEAGKFFKSGHGEHKKERIEEVLSTYPDMRFILIGDSGQKDPEIYRDVVERHGKRIQAIYLRDVTDAARDAEVRAIAQEVGERGVDMLLVEDMVAAAAHAADHGWIAASAVDQVRHEVEREESKPEDLGVRLEQWKNRVTDFANDTLRRYVS